MLAARLKPASRILAVVGVEEFAQRFDAADDQEQIADIAHSRHHHISPNAFLEHGIYEIVSSPLLSKLDLQTIPDEIDHSKRSIGSIVVGNPFAVLA